MDKDPDRQKEIDETLQRNVDNPFISKIYLLNETKYSFSSDKICQIIIGQRLQYSDAIKFANEMGTNDIFLLANNDIFFDQSLNFLEKMDWNNLIVVITRHDMLKNGKISSPKNYRTPEGSLFRVDPRYSHDAWAFKTPMIKFDCDFLLGKGNCESSFAYEAQFAGLEMKNGYPHIKAIHHHASNIRNYRGLSDSYKGPAALIKEDICGKKYRTQGILDRHRIVFRRTSDGEIIKPILFAVASKSHLDYYKNFFKPSFDKFLANEYDLKFVEIDQKGSCGDYYKSGWFDVTRLKASKIIEEFRSSKNDYVLFSDVDVLFLNSIRKDIEKHLTGSDMVFQMDSNYIHCTGLFAARVTDRVRSFFDYYEQVYDSSRDDQDNMDNALRTFRKKMKTKFKICQLPKEYFSVWRVTNEVHYDGGKIPLPDYPIKTFHANWTIGKENKLKLLRAYKDLLYNEVEVKQ